MGIVIAVVLLIGAIALGSAQFAKRRITNEIASYLLLIGGLWNAVWYGLRHLGSFWGNASIITGVLMVLAALSLFRFITLASVNRKLLALGLLAGFALYAITIVQLNLGYPIIT